MGLFNRKKKDFQFSSYNQKSLLGKDAPKMTSFDKIDYILIRDSSDDELFKVCDKILDGRPVLVKFEKLDIQSANKMLSFMSGVVYATYGKIIKVESQLFLMARKEEFEDGSLYQYVDDLVGNMNDTK